MLLHYLAKHYCQQNEPLTTNHKVVQLVDGDGCLLLKNPPPDVGPLGVAPDPK